MTYIEAVSFINSKLVFGSKPGLSRIGKLCELLGNPQKQLKFIHIAGTNGKGSTAAFIASILQRAGLKTGLYISPFVTEFRERMSVNGKYITEEELAEIIKYIKPFCEKVEKDSESPTEFELITACAFEFFKRKNCDIVVLETGLGGRFDATNIIDAPLLSVITSISFDHTQYLGNTLSEIAFEKCGIIKKGSAVVAYPLQQKEALDVIKKRSKEEEAPLFIPDIESLEILNENLNGSEIQYKGLKLEIPLIGDFQIYNCLTAIETVLALKKLYSFVISDADITDGIKNTRFPARFEIIKQNPLIIIDGAHNSDGIDKLIKSIELFIKDKEIISIMGMLKDKNYYEPISKIASLSESFIAVSPDNPRALPSKEAAGIAKEFCKNVIVCENFKDAAEKALKLSDKDSALLVCGSLYIAGPLRNLLK